MFMAEFGLDLIPSIIGMVLVQFLIAFLIYKGVIKRYLKDEMVMLTALILLTTIIEQIFNYRYPLEVGVFIKTGLIEGTTQIGEVIVSTQLLIAGGVAFVLTALFVLFFVKTKVGLAVRAISQDEYTSKIIGINVENLFIFTMMIVLLPVIISMLLVSPVWTIDPWMGQQYMATAILVAVLGGLGNLKGTILASFLIGAVNAFVSFILGEPRFMMFSATILVIVVLIVRPQGLTRSETLW